MILSTVKFLDDSDILHRGASIKEIQKILVIFDPLPIPLVPNSELNQHPL